ncbi:MAG TPA: pantoate--beta-alanine ligase [Candidatus Omnitrophota bacterium]|nr:pantoate--beta-alanine ligase [Candidatus Omnitrophota bacterium]
MKTVRSAREMSLYSKKAAALGRRIALVPTMGALHEGHLSLVEAAKRDADLVVVSIFVNPIQFGPNEDFKRYPRDLKQDLKKLSAFDPVVVFAPSAEEMYGKSFLTSVKVERMDQALCGGFRPGHFDGVTTVVAKLFNIVRPVCAFFGEKDFQQQVLIRKMARDLNFDIEIIALPTVREYDGLALSSRNRYLSEEERKAAPLLYRTLLNAKEKFRKGMRDADALIALVKGEMAEEPLIRIEYVEVVDPETLDDVTRVKGKALIAAAIFIGKTRLIDNLILGAK